MSTTARKARKRNRQAALEAGYIGVAETFRFVHPTKVGTTSHRKTKISRLKAAEISKAEQAIAGLIIDSTTVKQPGWFRRLFGTGSTAA